MLVELNVAVADALGIFVGDLGHLLSGLVHEVVFDEPLAHKLLRELPLGFALEELLLIAVGIKIAAGVGCVDFVDEIHFSVALAKLILRVDEDESLLGGNLLTASKEAARVVFHHSVVLSRDDALSDNLFTRDIQVVSLIGLCGGSDDGFGEPLVLTHAVGQLHSANLANTFLIIAPGRASENAANNHFHAEALALHSNGDHRVGCGEFPVGADVAGGIEELSCNLVEHLSLKWNAFWKDDIKGRYAVGSHHHHDVVVDVVYIAHLPVVHALLSSEVEVSFC